MKALVLTAPKQLSIQDIEIREPESDEIVIRVKACGVCGTDLHIFDGDEGAFENKYPLIMGHEFAGIVVENGDKAKKFKIGDHVAVDPNIYCGQCHHCLKGNVHFCENMVGIGTTVNGGFAEYCTVKEKAAYFVPKELPLDEAAMMEPISCCLHCIDRSNIHTGDTVAIIGFGSIGQIMLQLAICSGAARTIVIEPIMKKRNKALEMGANVTINPLTENIVAKLKNNKIDTLNTVIECVGKKQTMESAINIASNGATVMLFGLTPTETKLEIRAHEDIFKKELIITGSFINPLVAQRVIDLLEASRIDMSKVITDKVPLEDSIKVFTNETYRNSGKSVIGDF